jgi:hypothetical protein
MHGLTSDRFLRGFAGNLKRRWKYPVTNGKCKPQTASEVVAGSNGEEVEETQGEKEANNQPIENKQEEKTGSV